MEERKPYTSPIEGKYSSVLKKLEDIFRLVLVGSVDNEDIIVEYFKNENDFVVKLRQQWNDWLVGISYEDKISLLKSLRTELDKRGLQKVKVEYSEHSKEYEERNNIRMIFNPYLRRYEGIQVYFRTLTQDRRSTPLQEGERKRLVELLQRDCPALEFPW